MHKRGLPKCRDVMRDDELLGVGAGDCSAAPTEPLCSLCVPTLSFFIVPFLKFLGWLDTTGSATASGLGVASTTATSASNAASAAATAKNDALGGGEANWSLLGMVLGAMVFAF